MVLFSRNKPETAGEIAHRKEMEAKEQLLKQEARKRTPAERAEAFQQLGGPGCLTAEEAKEIGDRIKEREAEIRIQQQRQNINVVRLASVKRDVAVTDAARSIANLCDKLAAIDLPAAITGLTKAHGLTSILSALIGRNGIDARRLKQDSLEVATLVQMAVEMFNDKLAEGGGSTKADIDIDPELHDAEKDFNDFAKKP